MTTEDGWNETAKLDDESLRGVFGEGLQDMKKRRVIVTDREDRTKMNFSLLGAVVISVAVPVLLALVILEVLLGRWTVKLVKPAETAAGSFP